MLVVLTLTKFSRNSNAYVIDLPSDFGISSTFNISDFVVYKGHPFNPDNPLVNLDEPTPEPLFERHHLPHYLLQLSHLQQNKSISIKDDHIISTQDGGCTQYLMRWKGRPESDTWITREDLQRLTLNLLEYYESHLEPRRGQVPCTSGELMGTLHRLPFTRISAIVTVSQRPLFGCGFESCLIVIFFKFFDDFLVHVS